MPGKLIVIADGAPTSYVLTGLLQAPILTMKLKIRLDTLRIGILKQMDISITYIDLQWTGTLPNGKYVVKKNEQI